MTALDLSAAGRFARLALLNIGAEYPNKLDHVLESDGDALPPRILHPIFFGSYDWHSSVHMHWLLVRLLKDHPDHDQSAASRAQLEIQFAPDKVAGECAYLERAASRTFERTYGWAWLLALTGETYTLGQTDDDAARWASQLAPLAAQFRHRMLDFLTIAAYPIRTGMHANSAFGLLLARIYALQLKDEALRLAIDHKARQWFFDDANYPARFEPQGSDFLSAGLIEAALMHDVLGGGFAGWWQDFMPVSSELAHWLSPVDVADRSDAQMSHLDGLNLSRAWCALRIANALPGAQYRLLKAAAEAHLAAAMPHVLEGHYVGTHWLATFAALAMTTPAIDRL